MTSTRTTPAADTSMGAGLGPELTGMGEEDRAALAAEIRRLRSAAQITPGALAHRAGLSPQMIRRYERGGPGPLHLGDLRAIAAAFGTTAGALIDAHPATTGPAAGQTSETRPGAFVLRPTRPPSTEHSATVWRLDQYMPRRLGQRWEHPANADPGRTVSRAVLDWAAELIGRPADVFGSAIELTGERSWYIGPRNPDHGRRS